MKRLLVLSFFVAMAAQAQVGTPGASKTLSPPISPGSGATEIVSPAASATTYGSPAASATTYDSPAASYGSPVSGTSNAFSDTDFNGVDSAVPNNSINAPGAVGVPSAGNGTLDSANTAPTSIPDDTTLLNTPSGNPIRQSQEEFNSFPDTTVAPGTGSGPGTGTGTGNGVNTGPGTINNNFNSPAPATNP